MTARQRSIAARIGGTVAVIGGVVALLATAGKPVAEATGLATRSYVQATIGDSLAAHRRAQEMTVDSIARQVNAIRCVLDGDYASRHPDACKYGVEERP